METCWKDWDEGYVDRSHVAPHPASHTAIQGLRLSVVHTVSTFSPSFNTRETVRGIRAWQCVNMRRGFEYRNSEKSSLQNWSTSTIPKTQCSCIVLHDVCDSRCFACFVHVPSLPTGPILSAAARESLLPSNEEDIVETSGKAGDVMLTHPLLLHAR